ncbi:MAG: glycosyltransferase family 4 protein [Acidobacteria bacterium]|nr:glycosyltransferase family 4 protein [Acidobacteriota bacterium]
MRVAIDARELTGHTTGVGRYLSELLVEWQATGVDRRHELRLYAHAPPAAIAPGLAADIRVIPGAGGTRWEQWELARALGRDRPDVVFAPGYTAPLTAPAPTVVAIHDVSFFAHPEWFGWREGTRRRLLTAWSARRARLVLAPSAFSAAEVVRHTALDASRIRLVYPGVRPVAATAAAPRAPVVLFVGSLFQRRRLDVVIDAFARVAAARPDARLEIVGANRTTPHVDFAAAIAAHGLGHRARLRDWVDDVTLAGLYRDAAVFVFLSRYEGFGLTPLEAMAHGLVPVVLDTAVAREVYGDAAWRVGDQPELTAGVATAIGTLLDDDAVAARYRAAAPRVLAGYQWAETARRVLACLTEAAGA